MRICSERRGRLRRGGHHHREQGVTRLSPHNNTLTTNSSTSLPVVVVIIVITVGFRATSLRGLSHVTTTAPSTVELDPVPLASNPIALAVANWRRRVTHRRQRRGRRAPRRTRRPRGAPRARRAGRAVRVLVVVVIIGHARACKPSREVVHGGRKVGLADLTRGVGLRGLGVLDAPGRQGAAFGDFVRATAGTGGRGSRALASGDVENVQFAARGGFDSVVGSGVMRDLVAVHDVLQRN